MDICVCNIYIDVIFNIYELIINRRRGHIPQRRSTESGTARGRNQGQH